MINLICPINDLGYGVVSKNIFKALAKYNINLYPLNTDLQSLDKQQIEAYNRGMLINRKFPDLRVWHQHDLGYFISNISHAALTFFELSHLNKYERSHLNSLDILFVPSQWHKDVAQASEITTPIVILPMSVDTDIFLPIKTNYSKFLGYNQNMFMQFDKSVENHPTVFMTCGKWEIRKGHDIIIDCFERAFSKEDNVKLIVNCHNPFIGQDNKRWEERYSYRPNQIDIIPDRLKDQYDLARIYSMVDCGLFPARSEGWNMEASELLAMGKRCIMFNYAAHTQYAKDAGADTFDIDTLEVADDGVFFNSTNPAWDGDPGKWASIGDKQKDQIIEMMRSIHNEKQSNGHLTINKKGVEWFRNWTWDDVAEKIKTTLVV